MSRAALVAIVAVFAAAPASAQSLKQADCSAFQKQADGSYLVTKSTSIVDVSDNTVSIDKGAVIGPQSITINGWSGRDLIDQKCAAAAPAPVSTQADASQPPATTAAPPAPAAVPPPLPPAAQFYYSNNGQPAGPLGLADLQAKIAAGAIGPTTLVWKSGTPNWVAANQLSELSSSFAATPSQGAATADIKSFFFGTWETDGPGPSGTQGPAKMLLTLGQDGSVNGSYNVTLIGGATASIPVTGGWNATQTSDKGANLTLNLLVHGNGGTQPLNTTTSLEIVDQNTVRDTAQGTLSKRVKS